MIFAIQENESGHVTDETKLQADKKDKDQVQKF